MFGESLKEAYSFLRTLEHRIQLYELRRTHVVPEDVQAVLPGVVGHRLNPAGEGRLNGSDVAEHLIKQVAVP